MPLTWPTKYPDEVLDYELDWSDSLADGEEITSADAQVDFGSVTIASKDNGAASQRVWLQGGTSGRASLVRCTVTTSAGRTFEEQVWIRIR